MIRLVVIVVLLLLVAGGGAAWFFMLGPGAPAEENEEVDRGEELYVRADPLVLQVTEGGKMVHQVSIQFRIAVYGEEARAQVKSAMPRLRDAFIRATFLYANRISSTDEKYDLSVLERELITAANRVLGPDVIHDILFESVFGIAE